jgi:hypothetical protein
MSEDFWMRLEADLSGMREDFWMRLIADLSDI